MAESTAANPTLLQAQVANLLVQPLEAASVVLAAGPRIFDTASELRIPKLISSGTPAFVAEGAEIADTHDVEFDEVKLMPTNRRSIKTILRYTNELVRQSVVGIDAVLKARLVKDVSDLLDSALLTGAGATNSIRGITAQTGITPGELDVTDADCLLDAIAALNAKEVTPNRWFISGADFAALRKLKESTTSARYLLEPDPTKQSGTTIFGIPATITNKLPEGTAILADMSTVAIARDTSPSVTVLNERYAEFDQVGLRVTTRYDLGLLHAEAVSVLTADSGGS
ncbi:MAG TPA: phage major capsid protein [Gordonia sp. (in: high G+C Gram-positive bacteria)]|uniref:phage major capsid protein n=1 Tax=unclassified Gordonia (in: high G+C Gram-positive bacteria) TaxID=2657482 RepID=UPI0025C71811|nr:MULTISPECIES: phage major capsid protein [unclassified Gordonia (in: high G+C Gram-positive bacteria)]HNP58461.1 phage major capsid protein [Gordonia sp. (in: high G+C Gram-positive bacteria)]HRC51699.1 phage major capsid protein [Gordonia sp. (in: high G+C Gram-positive bacteria)]